MKEEPARDENVSTSELRLKLTEIARRVERQKVRIVIRRRFDAVGMMIPLEDFDRLEALPPMETIRSIRDARGGIADVIDRLAEGANCFLIEQRGQPIVALVPMQIFASLVAGDGHKTGSHGPGASETQTYRMSTVPASSGGSQPETAVIPAVGLVDQQGQPAFSDGIITLRSIGDKKFVWGILRPKSDASKLVIEIGERLVREFRPTANHPDYLELGEIEVDPAVRPEDIRLLRLA